MLAKINADSYVSNIINASKQQIEDKLKEEIKINDEIEISNSPRKKDEIYFSSNSNSPKLTTETLKQGASIEG